MRAIREGKISKSRRLGRKLGLLVEQWRGGAPVVTVREDPERAARGWGMLAIRPSSPMQTIIEVPHPIDDLYTDVLGVQLFEEMQASALLIAGSHRHANGPYTSDAARLERTLFQTAHLLLVESETMVVQLHGFSRQRHPDVVEQVILSDGTDKPARWAFDIGDRLDGKGLPTCVYGMDCNELGGETNLQMRTARKAGARSLHLELDLPSRQDPGIASILADALNG
ncbi:MAG: hypothetical protein ACLGH3_10280 [Actinomycetota bacterium]